MPITSFSLLRTECRDASRWEGEGGGELLALANFFIFQLNRRRIEAVNVQGTVNVINGAWRLVCKMKEKLIN